MAGERNLIGNSNGIDAPSQHRVNVKFPMNLNSIGKLFKR